MTSLCHKGNRPACQLRSERRTTPFTPVVRTPRQKLHQGLWTSTTRAQRDDKEGAPETSEPNTSAPVAQRDDAAKIGEHTSNSLQDAPPTGSDGGPRLPPRPESPTPDTSKGTRRPSPFQKPTTQAVLASYGAYTGFVGTLAVGSAWAADINLAGMFHLDVPALEQALLIVAPLQMLNIAIMLPEYSTWSLPKFNADEEDEGALNSTGRDGRVEVTTVNSTASVSAASTSKTADQVPANAWGKKKGLGRIVKDALHLAQGHYTANNPTGNVNSALEIAAAVFNSLAGELLYRGVAITLLGSWLNDRFYEAGTDDIIDLPLLGTSMTTKEAALWSAALLLVGLSMGLAIRKAIQPQRRMAFLVDLRQGGKQGKDGKPVTPTPTLPPPTFSNVLTLASAIQGGRNVTQTLVLNCIFVMSGGNLAASYAASLVNQLVFSLLQRYCMERTRQKSAALAKELQEFNKKLRGIQQKQAAKKAAAAAAAANGQEAADAVPFGSSFPVQSEVLPTASASDASQQASDASPPSMAVHSSPDMPVEESMAAGPLLATQLHSQASSSTQGAEDEVLMAAAVATAAAAADVTAQAAAPAPAVVAASGGGSVTDATGGSSQLARALLALDLLLPESSVDKAKTKA